MKAYVWTTFAGDEFPLHVEVHYQTDDMAYSIFTLEYRVDAAKKMKAVRECFADKGYEV